MVEWRRREKESRRNAAERSQNVAGNNKPTKQTELEKECRVMHWKQEYWERKDRSDIDTCQQEIWTGLGGGGGMIE